MKKFSESGFSQIIILLVLLGGVVLGGWLITQRTNILPRAGEPVSSPDKIKGNAKYVLDISPSACGLEKDKDECKRNLKSRFTPEDEIPMLVKVQPGTNILEDFKAQIKFSPELFEVISIDATSNSSESAQSIQLEELPPANTVSKKSPKPTSYTVPYSEMQWLFGEDGSLKRKYSKKLITNTENLAYTFEFSANLFNIVVTDTSTGFTYQPTSQQLDSSDPTSKGKYFVSRDKNGASLVTVYLNGSAGEKNISISADDSTLKLSTNQKGEIKINTALVWWQNDSVRIDQYRGVIVFPNSIPQNAVSVRGCKNVNQTYDQASNSYIFITGNVVHHDSEGCTLTFTIAKGMTGSNLYNSFYENSFIKNWTVKEYNNQTGTISLSGKVSEGVSDINGELVMAKVVLKSKNIGRGNITIDEPNSYIKPLNSGVNVLKSSESLNLVIKSKKH